MNSDVTDAHHILLLAKRDPPEIEARYLPNHFTLYNIEDTRLKQSPTSLRTLRTEPRRSGPSSGLFYESLEGQPSPLSRAKSFSFNHKHPFAGRTRKQAAQGQQFPL